MRGGRVLVNGRILRTVAAVAAIGGFAAPAGQAQADQKPGPVKHCTLPNVSTGTRTCEYTFFHSRTIETFVVPPTAVGPIEIIAIGAPGFGDDTVKSHGAEVTGSFTGMTGQPLFVVVGGDGYYDGYNGGEDGGGGGSDVRLGYPDLQHRIIVAGGGGSAGENLIFDQEKGIWRFIVVKGGDAGQPGLGGGGGQPGTASGGGAGGGAEPAKGSPGILGRGGHAADRGGGGGGGGYYGGGGGGGCFGGDEQDHLCTASQPGSGGGGSSLVPPGGTVSVAKAIEGSVTIRFSQYG
jgi:hypothetical protein